MNEQKKASTVLHTAAVLYKQKTKESCAVCIFISSMAFDDLSLSLLFVHHHSLLLVFMLVCTAAVHPRSATPEKVGETNGTFSCHPSYHVSKPPRTQSIQKSLFLSFHI